MGMWRMGAPQLEWAVQIEGELNPLHTTQGITQFSQEQETEQQQCAGCTGQPPLAAPSLEWGHKAWQQEGWGRQGTTVSASPF